MVKHPDPYEQAVKCVEAGVTIDACEKQQEVRRKRLEFWKERDIPVMIETETNLIKWADEVIENMYVLVFKKMVKK